VVNSGHAVYCVIRGVHLMLQSDPNIPKKASTARVEAANYFLLMLDVSAKEGFCLEKALCTFTGYFRGRKIQSLRLALIGWNTPYFFCSTWWNRAMPNGPVYRTLCTLKATLKGDGRLPSFHWPPLVMIISILRRRFVSFVTLTCNLKGSGGCLASPRMLWLFKFILGY